jgi:hypothetical protein
METVNVEMENEMMLDETNTLLKDSPKVDKEGLTKWLYEFRQTHYKNRFLTDHFWSVCYLSKKLDIDVRSVLGDEIWGYMRLVKPNPFEFYLSKPFDRLGSKSIFVDFHLVK